jgi:hypothetical protein
MTPQEFTSWLDGFLTHCPNIRSLNEEQTKRVKDKLSTVFNKVTPNSTNSFPKSPAVFDCKNIAITC